MVLPNDTTVDELIGGTSMAIRIFYSSEALAELSAVTRSGDSNLDMSVSVGLDDNDTCVGQSTSLCKLLFLRHYQLYR